MDKRGLRNGGMNKKPQKVIKGWAVICSDEGFLVAHWDFVGAMRQMEKMEADISVTEFLKCRHKVVPIEIKILNPKKRNDPA